MCNRFNNPKAQRHKSRTYLKDAERRDLMDQCGGRPNGLDDVAKSSFEPVQKDQSVTKNHLADSSKCHTSKSGLWVIIRYNLGARVPPPNSVSERPQDVQGCPWKHSWAHQWATHSSHQFAAAIRPRTLLGKSFLCCLGKIRDLRWVTSGKKSEKSPQTPTLLSISTWTYYNLLDVPYRLNPVSRLANKQSRDGQHKPNISKALKLPLFNCCTFLLGGWFVLLVFFVRGWFFLVFPLVFICFHCSSLLFHWFSLVSLGFPVVFPGFLCMFPLCVNQLTTARTASAIGEKEYSNLCTGARYYPCEEDVPFKHRTRNKSTEDTQRTCMAHSESSHFRQVWNVIMSNQGLPFGHHKCLIKIIAFRKGIQRLSYTLHRKWHPRPLGNPSGTRSNSHVGKTLSLLLGFLHLTKFPLPMVSKSLAGCEMPTCGKLRHPLWGLGELPAAAKAKTSDLCGLSCSHWMAQSKQTYKYPSKYLRRSSIFLGQIHICFRSVGLYRNILAAIPTQVKWPHRSWN